VYGSLFLGVIMVCDSHSIFPAEEDELHVIRNVSIHFFFAFSAKIGACFSHEADKIITPSISFFNDSSKLVSSQNIA
jgi:hypothetical protein